VHARQIGDRNCKSNSTIQHTAGWTRSVVEQQSAHIPAEWLLLLGGLLRGGSGSSSDLGISWALLHADVG
jgi:hypothetical protein